MLTLCAGASEFIQTLVPAARKPPIYRRRDGAWVGFLVVVASHTRMDALCDEVSLPSDVLSESGNATIRLSFPAFSEVDTR